mgnify:CR=1 FL=1
MPEQQSSVCAQRSPRARHRQRPFTHAVPPQHADESRHGPPALAQHWRTPVLKSRKHTSEPQHSEFMVHVRSPCCRHPVGYTHMPPVHERPAQQSVELAQALPIARHRHTRGGVAPASMPLAGVGVSQRVEPQHSVSAPQTEPTPWQQRLMLLPGAEGSQRSPVQQRFAVPDAAHPTLPSGRHTCGARQMPSMQVVPGQQSSESVQISPSASHAQVRVSRSQSICPQHCADELHAWPCRWQHTFETGAGRHSKSPQQVLPVAHVVPPARHDEQLPSTHESVPRHASAAQHGCAMPPHEAGGIAQVPD